MEASEFEIWPWQYSDDAPELVHKPCGITLLSITDDSTLAELIAAAEAHDCETAKRQRDEKRAAEQAAFRERSIASARRVLAEHGLSS